MGRALYLKGQGRDRAQKPFRKQAYPCWYYTRMQYISRSFHSINLLRHTAKTEGITIIAGDIASTEGDTLHTMLESEEGAVTGRHISVTLGASRRSCPR